jgi:HEAT repeat protein
MHSLLLASVCCVLVPCGQAGTESRTTKKVQELLKDLKSPNWKTRVYAADEIGHVAQLSLRDAKPAIPDLLKALKDTRAEVRRAAALALVKVEAPAKELVPAFLDMVQNDKDMLARTGAVTALGQLGSVARDAVPVLTALRKKVQAEQPPKDKKPAKDKTKKVQMNQVLLREIDMALRFIQAK